MNSILKRIFNLIIDPKKLWRLSKFSAFRIRISFYADPNPGSQKSPHGSGSIIFYADPDPGGVNIKKEKLHQQIFNWIFKNDIEKSKWIKKNINLGITKGSLLLFVQFCIHLMNFLGFFTSWIRIRIQEAFFMRIRANLDSKHCNFFDIAWFIVS